MWYDLPSHLVFITQTSNSMTIIQYTWLYILVFLACITQAIGGGEGNTLSVTQQVGFKPGTFGPKSNSLTA